MRRHRLAARPLAMLLALLLLLQPLTPRPSAAGELTSESRVGVALMVMCGLALKATLAAPVPWSGVAVVSCLMGFLDAAFTPDEQAPPSPPPAP
jgi:hypothetical protein